MVSKENLKILIEKISDPRVKSRSGMAFCAEEGYKDLAESYARQYLGVFNIADGAKSVYSWEHPVLDALAYLSKEEQAKVLPQIKQKVIADAERDLEKTEGLVKLLSDRHGQDFPELERIMLAKEMLGYYPRIEDSKKDEALAYAADTVFSTWKTSRKLISGGERLFLRKDFQEKYSGDPIAREIASDLVGRASEKEVYGIGLEQVGELAKAYQVTLDMPKIVRETLKIGKIESAENFGNMFGYTLSNEDIEEAVAKFKVDLEQIIQQGNIQQALDVQTRLEAFRDYSQNGLNINSIPQVELVGNGGKFILINFKDKTFLRGAKAREGYHQDILNRFQSGLELKGFDNPCLEGGQVSGAHYSIRENKMTIKGKSEDYGECDKDLAKQLMSQVFPGEIIIERERKEEW